MKALFNVLAFIVWFVVLFVGSAVLVGAWLYIVTDVMEIIRA